MIATSLQSRRILFLKTHLRNLFQGNTTNYPSIMFYNKTLLSSCTDYSTEIADFHHPFLGESGTKVSRKVSEFYTNNDALFLTIFSGNVLVN